MLKLLAEDKYGGTVRIAVPLISNQCQKAVMMSPHVKKLKTPLALCMAWLQSNDGWRMI
jgi:hypothetical protein